MEASGPIANIYIKGDRAIIESRYIDDLEEPFVEIDRLTLVHIIEKWQEITNSKPDKITMTLEDNGEISIVGTFCE